MASDAIGAYKIGEAIYGYDIVTGEELDGEQRLVRAFGGTGQLILSAVGLKGAANRATAGFAKPKATPVEAPKSGLRNATSLTPDEIATGQRLESLLGRPLKESPHVGADFIDDLGRSYDALGTPAASKFWNQRQFLNQIDKHLLKSNDFTVIDLTGFTPDQITVVRNYVNSLPAELQSKIIRIGF